MIRIDGKKVPLEYAVGRVLMFATKKPNDINRTLYYVKSVHGHSADVLRINRLGLVPKTIDIRDSSFIAVSRVLMRQDIKAFLKAQTNVKYTKVDFRRDLETGEILAVMNDLAFSLAEGHFDYERAWVGTNTVPATPKEYDALKRAMETYPYYYRVRGGNY